MTIRGLRAGLTILLLAATAGPSAELDWRQHQAVQESLARVPPRLRGEWLDRCGLTPPRWNAPLPVPEPGSSLGLVLRGKWGRGPAAEVTGRDSLVAFTLGSEVALLNCANPFSPVVLSEIQLDLIPRQTAFYDSFLVTSDDGIEFWNIEDPRAPVFRGSIPYTVGDFAIVDTFVFFVRGDTFHAYSIADPASPYQLGTCLEGGYVTAATRNVAVIRIGNVMDFVDVSDPSAPHYAGTYPGWVWSAAARGNLCCATFADASTPEITWFATIDISNPASPVELARRDGVCGDDIYLEDSLAYVSGREEAYDEEFRIISIADSTNPRLRGTCSIWDINYGVWACRSRRAAYVASVPTGLAIVDVSNLDLPRVDTFALTADCAWSVYPDGDRAYVADLGAGLRILDVSDPTRPVELGGLDSSHVYVEAAVARDSFAFIGWCAPPFLRTLDVSDPTRPVKVGGCNLFNWPEAMVLRDTLLYIAEYARFQIVNVARPRQPVVVGTCVLSGAAGDVCLVDTLAYVSSYPAKVINVTDPISPRVIATIPRGVWNIAIRDTYAFVSSGGIVVYSVANPAQPRLLDSLSVGPNTYWVEAVGNLLYVGNPDGVRLVEASDVHNMRVLAFSPTPDVAMTLTKAPECVYAACYIGGVSILDTITVGVSETRPEFTAAKQASVWPSVVRDHLLVAIGDPRARLNLYSASGTDVTAKAIRFSKNGSCREVDMGTLPAGVYIVCISNPGGTTFTAKVIKANGR